VTDLVTKFQISSLQEVGCGYLVDSREAVAHLVDSLLDLPASPPSIYIDIEGVNLCRSGSISILQILVLPLDKTYLVDVHVLKDNAFTTMGEEGQTLKDVLESATIPKVFFDVRNDSDALFSHFGVNLVCIQDIQLMQLATRTYNRKYVNGLSKCIEKDITMTASEKRQWMEGKGKGKRLFAPELGGSYEVFNERPLPEEIAIYCTQDVRFMPKLWKHYSNRLSPAWARKVEVATKDRITLSQTAGYDGKGSNRALGPW
jgi:exonuclease 3'-5' domain-containing protein 1